MTLAQRHHWRMVLIGDPHQFSAVGRSGMFEYLTRTHPTIHLDQVHRFTNSWEAAASLRLRQGDPDVLSAYVRHDRIHHGTQTRTHYNALTAWANQRSAGETALLLAPSNAVVGQLNDGAQQRRIEAGQLDPVGPRTRGRGGQLLLVGDEVVTRSNLRDHHTDHGHPIRNRDTWTITDVDRDGVQLDGPTGRTRLPLTYVREHLELGYAQTSHAAQGRTVDHAHLVLDQPTTTQGIYVPLTRGRHTNHIHITAPNHDTAIDLLTQSLANSRGDQPAITQHLEAAPSLERGIGIER